MVEQNPVIAILTYALLIFCLAIAFIGISFGFNNANNNVFSMLTGVAIVSFVALAKTTLCTLLVFSFFYFDKKHENLLIILCIFILLLPVTLYTANSSNIYNNLDWFINNPFTILLLTILGSLFILIKQVLFNLNKNLIKVSILDGIKIKDFFIKIYFPAARINITTILLMQFIYGYVKF